MRCQIESAVEPDSVADDIWRESVAFICVHEPILPISGGLLGRTLPVIDVYSQTNLIPKILMLPTARNRFLMQVS